VVLEVLHGVRGQRATNVWLGFPFMMVVTLGALTAIPKDVLEAAEVDGATRWQRFRLVVLPMLATALARRSRSAPCGRSTCSTWCSS
jgi:ABC-type glycerol-3-phosphate transport system permease component